MFKLGRHKNNSSPAEHAQADEWPIEWPLVAVIAFLICLFVAIVLWFLYAKDAP
jgi:hypothetical protein